SLLQTRGSVWSGSMTLRWLTHDPNNLPGLATISFSVDHGHSWQPLVVAIPDTGSYVLDTSTLPNGDQIWLRVMVTGGRFTGMDIMDEPITVANPLNPFIRLNPVDTTNNGLTLSWTAVSLNHHPVKVTLLGSLDGGQTWNELANDLPAKGSLNVQQKVQPQDTPIIFRAAASDDRGTAFATSEQVDFTTSQVSQPLFEP
ncbi:MAG: hypothetical protein ACYC6L_14055, partial [Anaerolineae bacterium]